MRSIWSQLQLGYGTQAHLLDSPHRSVIDTGDPVLACAQLGRRWI